MNVLASSDEITSYLANHRRFAECLLEDVCWMHYGSVIEFRFNYVWEADGTLRSDILMPLHRSLTFQGVQELHVFNALNEHMMLAPEKLDWGISEVAIVELVEDSALTRRYQQLPLPMHHVRCRWESQRRIDVVFSVLLTGE